MRTLTRLAIEAADVALMRDDWRLLPAAIRLGRRSARTIRQNLWFTAAYNLIGIGLAALGVLAPVWTAAASGFNVVVLLRTVRASCRRLSQRLDRFVADDEAIATFVEQQSLQ